MQVQRADFFHCFFRRSMCSERKKTNKQIIGYVHESIVRRESHGVLRQPLHHQKIWVGDDNIQTSKLTKTLHTHKPSISAPLSKKKLFLKAAGIGCDWGSYCQFTFCAFSAPKLRNKTPRHVALIENNLKWCGCQVKEYFHTEAEPFSMTMHLKCFSSFYMTPICRHLKKKY